MRKSKYLILGLLILLMVTVFSLRKNIVHKTEDNKSHIQQQEKQKIIKKVEKSKKIQKANNENKQVNNQKLPYIYSDDPVVEANIIGLKYSVCFSYFMFQNNPKLHFEVIFRSEKQRSYFKKASANCEKLNKAHPEFHFNRDNKSIFSIKNKVATSKVGRMIKLNRYPISANESEKDSIELYSILGREYPELISYLFMATIGYEINTIYPDIKSLLSITNSEYAGKIIYLSKLYLSCQLSTDCEMGSNTLMTLCLSEPNFCVSSFDEFFNKRLSQGVQADVLLVLPYFKRLYNVD